jgi:hypothetical protein
MPDNGEFFERTIVFLGSLNRFTRAIEGLVIDLIAAISPWLTPLLPAYLTYTGLVNVLRFPTWAALAAAVVIETVGLSSVVTTNQLVDYNDSRLRSEQRAPIVLSMLTAVFYLGVVLSVNVLLDGGSSVDAKITKGLLSSLSICAGIILGIRSQHARRIEANLEVREERKTLRNTRRDVAQDAQVAQNPQVAHTAQVAGRDRRPTDWRELTSADRQSLIGLSPEEIRAGYPEIAFRTAQQWAQRVRMNGNGTGQDN